MRPSLLMPLLALSLMWGCDKPKDEPAKPLGNEAPKEAALTTATAAAKDTATTAPEKEAKPTPPKAPPALKGFDRGPFHEEGSTTAVIWKGDKKESVAVLSAPKEGAKKIHQMFPPKGTEITYSAFRTNIAKPRGYRFTASHKLTLAALNPETKEAQGEGKEVAFEPGELYYKYHYAGEGECAVGYPKGDAFVFAYGWCPDQDSLKEGGVLELLDDTIPAPAKVQDKDPAIETQAWIKVPGPKGEESKSGWVRVDGPMFELRAKSIPM